jgi:hypothetical protein
MATAIEKLPESLRAFHNPNTQHSYSIDGPANVQYRLNTTPFHVAEDVASHSLVRPHLQGSEYADPKKAIVMPFPFAIGLNPSMYMRAEYMANTIVGGMNVLALTSLAIGSRAVALTKQQRGRIAKGDFTPQTDSQIRAIEKNGIETVHMFNYSLGVPTGLALAERIQKSGVAELETVTAIESPNSQMRTALQLAKDFGSTPVSDLNEAIRDTEIPAYVYVSHAGVGGRGRITQNVSLLKYMAGAALPANVALARGMCTDTVGDQISAVVDDDSLRKLHHIRAENSTIVEAGRFTEINRQFEGRDNFDSFSIPGYGHEAGDQIVLMAALARRAITAAA